MLDAESPVLGRSLLMERTLALVHEGGQPLCIVSGDW